VVTLSCSKITHATTVKLPDDCTFDLLGYSYSERNLIKTIK